MEEKSDLVELCNHLERMAKSTNAGRAYVDFTRENGDVFRIEYKPFKKKTK